jgi:acetylornithine deacetylase
MGGTQEAQAEAIRQVDPEQVVALARGALQTPSYSGEEVAAAEYFAGEMRRIGLAVELQSVPQPDRDKPSANAVGRLAGSGGAPSLMFNGHTDHNPVCDGWTHDPFAGDVDHGWLYGFVHMKSANAAYIAAVDAVRRAGIALAGDVVLAHVCRELGGGLGTRHLLASGVKADYFVLGEPTELTIGLVHTASLIFRLTVRGRMKHFATLDTPDARGVNAIVKLAKLIHALGPCHQPLAASADGGWLDFQPHAGFEGLPQLNIGSVRGGIGPGFNASRPALLADTAELLLDVRIVPGMDRQTVERDLRRLCDRLVAEDRDFACDVASVGDTFPHPFSAPPDSPVVAAVSSAHAAVHGVAAESATALKFAASDASWLSRAGITGVIYGPSGRYLSRPDERCETADIVNAAKVYAATVVAICGKAA